MARVTVLKLGGELLEEPGRVAAIAKVIKQTAAKGPLVVVHGGGREIDRALFDDLLETLEIGSLCALGGGLPLGIKNALQYFDDELKAYFKA